MAAPAPTPDIDVMKQVNRQFVTGVTVVTAMDGETPRGLAVNAFSSISLDPPTVMVCVQHTSSTHDCLFRAAHLAINILSTDQLEVVGTFASKAADKFSDLEWESGPYGSPLIARSSAQMEVQIRERLRASTHTPSSSAEWCTPRSPSSLPWCTARAGSSTAGRSRPWGDPLGWGRGLFTTCSCTTLSWS